jgi:hypothetical protein
MNLNDQFKRISEKVEQLTFSDMNTFLLMKYAEEACSLAGKNDTLAYTAFLLPRGLKITDAQIRPLLEKDVFPKEKRQRFYDLKTNLERNLKQCFT